MINRRRLLQTFAAGAALAAGVPRGLAGEARISSLIVEAKALPGVAQRIDFIAAALRGTRYRRYTLIGGPQQPEKFVVRDDGFDCVTFCETVLAAAMAHDLGEFENNLRAIRYHNGVVAWRERNHYFFEWGQHNIDNKTCRPVALGGAVELQKTVYWHRELGRRHFSMSVIPRATLLANKDKLATGDIIGFVTMRPNLDYFHVGFVAFGKDGGLLLRHASLSQRRVLDERMDGFLSANRVRYVTLLRAMERTA
ncbi:MAG: N-acetylmuramoyl-L-alanine amidase-like domain-containing protein [Pseudolabrys sp.]